MTFPVLVTGVAGFIGFHTALRLLEQDRYVVGIDNMNDYYDVSLKEARLKQLRKFKNFEFEYIDISDKKSVENLWNKKGPFLEVIHLAAQAGVRYSLKNPYSYITSNCMGHVVIMEMCRHTKGFKHLAYASSSSVYGSNTKMPYSVEDSVDQPISLYAATKRSDELMSHAYSHLYKIPQTAMRFFTVYGPWGRPDMALFIFTKAICAGEKIPIFNNGNMKRDFTYIDDVVSGVLSILERPPELGKDEVPHRILNIGNNRSENLLDFVKVIEKALGKKADIEYLPMQDGDVLETYADISETTRISGYETTTTINEGIPKFIEWYKEYYNIT